MRRTSRTRHVCLILFELATVSFCDQDHRVLGTVDIKLWEARLLPRIRDPSSTFVPCFGNPNSNHQSFRPVSMFRIANGIRGYLHYNESRHHDKDIEDEPLTSPSVDE